MRNTCAERCRIVKCLTQREWMFVQNFDVADRVLATMPKEQRTRAVLRVALDVATDPKHW